jgi:hypothetical protein
VPCDWALASLQPWVLAAAALGYLAFLGVGVGTNMQWSTIIDCHDRKSTSPLRHHAHRLLQRSLAATFQFASNDKDATMNFR